MNKKEVLAVIMKIENLFNNPWTRKRHYLNEGQSDSEVIIDVVNTWHSILKDFDAELVNKNLTEYVKTNTYTPKIADLLKGHSTEKSNVPTLEETRILLDSYDNKEIAPPEVRQKALNEIAQMLGIKRRKETQ